MPFKVRCQSCEAVLSLPDAARGKVVSCPRCGEKTRAGGGKKKRPAQATAPRRRQADDYEDEPLHEEDFLTRVNVAAAERSVERICAKCGARVDEDDIECPKCGADPDSGGLGRTQRLRRDRGGYDPEKYYGTVFGDAWSFTMANFNLAMKTGIIYSIFGLVSLSCLLMILWLVVFPPKPFFAFFGAVATVIPIGWLWVLQCEITNRMMQPKTKLKLKKVRFDAFLSAASGLKLIAWSSLVALPAVLLEIGGGFLYRMDGQFLWLMMLGAGLLLHLLILMFVWGPGMAHQAMPISMPAWNPRKMMAMLSATAGPTCFCFIAILLGLLAFVVYAGVAGAVAYSPTSKFIGTMMHNKEIAIIAMNAQEGRQVEEPQPYAYWQIAVPAVLFVPGCFLFGIGTLYGMRASGYFAKHFKKQLDLDMSEKEVKYVPKPQKTDEELAKEEEMNFGKLGLIMGAMSFFGLIGGFIYSMISSDTDMVPGIGLGMAIAGGIMMLISWGATLTAAWQEGFGWWIFVFLIRAIGLIVFNVMHFEKGKYWLVLYGYGFFFMLIGYVIMIASALSEV
ncbi:hypothetical protein [Calycomorphotria hydatis]|uniref:Double zinc ribbon n=1 Tax=Calycomorphotria hydatis TaxID=2528027 RepID=A0A517TDF4_9PLAN|nr:hypothetical protein [Calycomorphotria hydatis]QDT66410.1 hypothetical protein V22_36770 [Calycomorphotria hydatis]